MLVRRKAERIPEIKETAMIEGLTEEIFDSMAAPRVINTHVDFQYLPKDLFAKRCKIVYILRNPKDIAVSYYNHHKKILMYEFDGPWDNYFQRFMQGNGKYFIWFTSDTDYDEKKIKRALLFEYRKSKNESESPQKSPIPKMWWTSKLNRTVPT